MTKQLEMNVDLKEEEKETYEVHLYSKDDPLCWKVACESFNEMTKELDILDKLIDKDKEAQAIVEEWSGKPMSKQLLKKLRFTHKIKWPKELLDPLYKLYLNKVCKKNPGVWISTIDLDYYRELGEDVKTSSKEAIAAYVEKSENAYATRKINKAKKMYITDYDDYCAWYERNIAKRKGADKQEWIDEYNDYEKEKLIVLNGTNEQIVDLMA